MTCNPKWPEIQDQLQGKERAEHRPDICARVFSLKVKSLIHDIKESQILGRLMAYTYTIEWQKRGDQDIRLYLCVPIKVFLFQVSHMFIFWCGW